MWKQWVNALLGLWTIVIPFTGMVGNTLMWALIITGIAVAVLALWSIQDVSSEHEVGERGERMVPRT